MLTFKLFSLLLFSLLMGIIGQLFLKHGMNQFGPVSVNLGNVISKFIKILSNVNILIGFSCYLLSAFSWLILLSHLPLSLVYPMISITYVIIVFSSKLIFHEHIPAIRWLGISIICLGIILLSRSA